MSYDFFKKKEKKPEIVKKEPEIVEKIVEPEIKELEILPIKPKEIKPKEVKMPTLDALRGILWFISGKGDKTRNKDQILKEISEKIFNPTNFGKFLRNLQDYLENIKEIE